MRKITAALGTTFKRNSKVGRGALTLVVLAALGSLAIFATQATFSDSVTMASISVTGGSLDLLANGDTGDSGVAWSGTISANVTGMAPGDTASGTVLIKNNGSLPFALTASSTGTDASGCFGYYLHDGTTDITGMGTDDTTDGNQAALATSVTGSTVTDSGAATWAAGDTETYTMTVRMLHSCTTNGAAGTLAISLDAEQV